MLEVFVLSGPEKGKAFELGDKVTSVGRAPQNDIKIRDSSVSREHLKIIRKGNRFLVEDLGSINGTFVNGRRVRPGKRVEVKEGLPITIGRVMISLGKLSAEDVGAECSDHFT